MSTRSSRWPAGTPCWADLSVPDVGAATAFYAATLGWEYDESTEAGGYVGAQVAGKSVGAIGPKQSPDQPDAWLPYFASDDVDRTATAITASGGTVVLAPGDVGSLGRLAVAVDPTGAVFGVWQAGTHIGAQRVNESGCLTWEDLRSTDPARAHQFYADVFGLETRAIDMAPETYRTFHLPGDDAPLGGMGGFMGPESASHWLLYFGVSSTDEVVARVAPAGGSVVTPPFDSPYGRMAGIADINGAVFHVIEVDLANQPDRSG